ncbi:hypothetical protein QBC35DRAFT_378 [Podospora australis]|uniref:Histone deacetylase complex subunit SAP30 Sin3 binding domain-containing protein n=1 Tax=Podospora australis TaxID=1536484 RepID=A0AAN6X3Y6_9PEZI|nr:hypothetical protein QBC35DRAFT_378 [Podospora australis]
MPPAKAARGGGHDDSKSDTPNTREKNGGPHHSNGKMRRVASSTGSNLREVTNASSSNGPTSAPASGTTTQQTPVPGLQWPAFDRDVLHAYRRAYRLRTPTTYMSDHHQWVLTQPGSLGLYSPTIARRKDLRRQTTDQLTTAVRKHFNGLGAQENDIIVEFIHKIRTQEEPKKKARKPKEYIHLPPELDK